jgi:uncharacterized protein YceH (UPF0502 family)
MLHGVRLNAVEARVLGSLMEKRLTTPQQYPLTLPSLVAACNQASNRDPVVAYDEDTVVSTLDELKAQGLLRFVLPSHGRTAMRYRHVLDEALALDDGQCALLAVLFLRGPQTIGELRIRTDRMAQFDGLAEIEHELDFMGSREEPLAVLLDRRPGQKEQRWTCPLVDVAQRESGVAAAGLASTRRVEPAANDGEVARHPQEVRASLNHAVDDLRVDVDSLRSELADLRRDLQVLRSSLGE